MNGSVRILPKGFLLVYVTQAECKRRGLPENDGGVWSEVEGFLHHNPAIVAEFERRSEGQGVEQKRAIAVELYEAANR